MKVLQKPIDDAAILLTIQYPKCSLNLTKDFFEDFKTPTFDNNGDSLASISLDKKKYDQYGTLRLSFCYNWDGDSDDIYRLVSSFHLMPLEGCIYPKDLNIFEYEALVYTDRDNYEMYRQYIAYDYSERKTKKTQIINIGKKLSLI
jgi:hypothetical protein